MSNPIVEKVGKWLWSICIKKGVKSLVKVAISFVTSVKVTSILQGAGIDVNATALEGSLTMALTSLLTMAQDWVEYKLDHKPEK